GVRDDSQPVGAIQLTSLLGNVRGGEEQSIEDFHRRGGGFSDYLTMTLFLEAIDQHPVIAGHRLNFPDDDVVQLLQGGRYLQALEHASEVGVEPCDVARLKIIHVDFQLEDQHALMPVQQTLECRVIEVKVKWPCVAERRLQQRRAHRFGMGFANQPV